MNKKIIITILIVGIVVAAIYLMRGKESPELKYAKNVLGLSQEQAEKVVEFANTQILNRADGKDGWRESTAKKAQERGTTLEQQALAEAKFHMTKHNQL